MTAQEICSLIQEKFPGAVTAALPADKHPRIEIDAANWRAIAEFLHGDPRLQFRWLANLTGLDYAASGKLAVVYDLYSLDLKHTFAVKVFIDREKATVPSVHDLWSIANWHEREAWDMFGIVFEGHPDLNRILCADDWVGHPLRKDYVFPKEYHGIPGDPGMPWDPNTVAQQEPKKVST